MFRTVLGLGSAVLTGIIGLSGTEPGAIAQTPASDVGTCASHCPQKPIQFTPGQRITVQVINRTNRTIAIERVEGGSPMELRGQQQVSFKRWGNTEPNASIIFWETNETPLKTKLSQVDAKTLRIELSFAPVKPGDRAIYIRNDGRVDRL